MRALHFKSGRLVGVLEPGFYRFVGLRHSFQQFDTRPEWEIVGGQEVMTSDGAPLRVSLSIQARIVDVRLHYLTVGDSEESLYPYRSNAKTLDEVVPFVKAWLRSWAAERTLEEAMAARDSIVAEAEGPISEIAGRYGLGDLELYLIEYSLAGNVKAAYNDLLRAELEGRAALTRARNEAATMRSLMNTVRLVRENPGLLELRALTAGQKPRIQFTIGGAASVAADES